MDLDETWNISGTTVRTHIKKFLGDRPSTETGFVFFRQGYNAAFRTLILHRFQPFLKQTDMNQHRGFASPKTASVGWVGSLLSTHSVP